jgi:glycosyltransferase involved in cell wall biosynthesis
MTICLFSPYLPNNFGGGEKYLLDCAQAFAQNKEHKVFVAVSSTWPNLSSANLKKIKQDYEQFMGINLNGINFITTPLASKANFIKKYLWTRNFDVLFYLTDGSLFFSGAKRNILHIQVPLKLDKSGWLEQQKLKNWHKKITNSYFTKSIIEPSWQTKIDLVHQPMVKTEPLIASTNFAKKEKIILNVGRFFPQLHSKRQDILVKIFARLLRDNKSDLKDWKLILIGNVEDKKYAKRVRALAKGLPIEIKHAVSRQQLINYFQRSSIYWHATGYRVNEQKNPEKVEHFGITTVEAMACGNVPVVLGKGGQIEVTGKDFQDWQWLTQQECVKKTRQLIKNDDLRLQLQKKAQQRSMLFSPKIFTEKLEQLLH